MQWISYIWKLLSYLIWELFYGWILNIDLPQLESVSLGDGVFKGGEYVSSFGGTQSETALFMKCNSNDTLNYKVFHHWSVYREVPIVFATSMTFSLWVLSTELSNIDIPYLSHDGIHLNAGCFHNTKSVKSLCNHSLLTSNIVADSLEKYIKEKSINFSDA